MKKVITSFNEALELTNVKNGEFDANFTVEEDGTEYKVHACHISHGGLSLYTDKACLSYVVDYYGDRAVIELYEVES